ncbi:MAG TPA: hypothetical protein VHP11_16465 [Tepidisphaeraceae bacterium]|nr:hypothetical protein [Tepidisphaeraceae bacterium]
MNNVGVDLAKGIEGALWIRQTQRRTRSYWITGVGRRGGERLSGDLGARVFGAFEFLGTLIGITIEAVRGLRQVFLAVGLYLFFYGWTHEVAVGFGASLIGLAIPLPRRGRSS